MIPVTLQDTDACQNRLKQLKRLALSISLSTTPVVLQDLVALTKLAYQVRRSFSFKQLVEYNISKSEKSGIPVPGLRDIVERLGQISKFYRAADTLTTYMSQLLNLGKCIEIKATPTEKIEISELARRTAADVCHRGGYQSTSKGGKRQIQDMLNRWPTYREHVELQLIVFYEQNPSLTLFSPYIGCNKRSCYLCYNFIAEHGRFQVDGCHQSLYSLWAVRDTVSFANEERAIVFKRALRNLGSNLKRKVETQKGHQWRLPGFDTCYESVANLSRISLAPNSRTMVEPSFEMRADNAETTLATNGVGALATKSSSVVTSVTNLRPVPEESLEEFTVTRMSCKPLEKNTILPDDSVDTAYEDSYSHVEKDAVVPQPGSHIELVTLTINTQADSPDTAQGLPDSLIASPLLITSGVDCSEDVSKESQEPPAPDRPRRRRRRRRSLGHQSGYSRSLQHDSRVSRRPNKADSVTRYRAGAKKGRKRHTKSPTDSPRRKLRSSLKHTLIGFVRVVWAIFGGLRGQETRV